MKTTKKIKLILFDFDGTIADSLPIALKVERKLERKFSYPKLKYKEKFKEQSFSNSISETLHLSKLKLFLFFKRFVRELNKEIKHTKVFPGIKEVLFELNKDYRLEILSTNITKTPSKNIDYVLEKANIDYYFSDVHHASFFKGKANKLKEILKKHSLKHYEVIYIGDEVNDIKACKKVRIKCISAIWGFNNEYYLKQNNAKYIVHFPKEILSQIKDIELKLK